MIFFKLDEERVFDEAEDKDAETAEKNKNSEGGA